MFALGLSGDDERGDLAGQRKQPPVFRFLPGGGASSEFKGSGLQGLVFEFGVWVELGVRIGVLHA